MADKNWIRHGDVILQNIEKIKGIPEYKDRTILAEGEVTGHKHILSGQIVESCFENERYIEVLENAKLEHQEHNTLQIPKGKYRVLIQREVDLLGEVRQVMD